MIRETIQALEQTAGELLEHNPDVLHLSKVIEFNANRLKTIEKFLESVQTLGPEAKLYLADLETWDDKEFAGNPPGHKLGKMLPSIKIKKLLNKLIKLC